MGKARIAHLLSRIAAIGIVGSLAAREFTPDLYFMDWGSEPARSFKPESINEVPEEYFSIEVVRLFDELYDPYNLPQDMEYRGSVFERMDVILAGAYPYYGYDLDKLARNRQNNLVSDQMFLEYIASQHVETIEDPLTGERFPVYDWLQSRIIGAGEGVYSTGLDAIGGLDTSYPLNYERNYLAALMDAHKDQVD